jgi:hypothetical protein
MRFKQFIVAGFCGLLIPLVVVAQKKPFNAKARELFVSQKADGLEVMVKWRDRNGQFTVIDPSREFKMGDQLRVEFRSNFDGLVYFLNINPRGALKVIHKDTVYANTVNVLPGGSSSIEFDNDSGIEVLKIILTRQPINEFETALRAGGEMGTTNSGVADELANRPKTKVNETEVGFVTPKPNQECGGLEFAIGGKKTACRGLIVTKGNDKKGEGAVFVAASNLSSSTPAKNSSLQAGEFAVIELRFRHVRVQ